MIKLPCVQESLSRHSRTDAAQSTGMSIKGQVWVETVIYTLIGLSLIGVVLAFVTPKIQEYQDKAIIEQTIDSFNILDKKINEVLSAPLNTRIVEFQLKKGKIYFDSENNEISFILENSRSLYSEDGLPVQNGRVTVTTTKGSKRHEVKLVLKYDFDLQTETQTKEEFSPSPSAYKFAITNKGFIGNAPNQKAVIYISEVS